MDYISYATYHPYIDVGASRRFPHPVATAKAFPHGVSLGTTGLPTRTAARKLLDLERNEFPGKYERRAILDRIRSKRQAEDFSLYLRPSYSDYFRPKSSRRIYVSPWTIIYPLAIDVETIHPISRYPVRPVRQIALSPQSIRCVRAHDDQDLDPLTIEMEAEEVRLRADKEAHRVLGAMWQSQATDRAIRLCQERNRIRNLEKRLENARLVAPVYMSPETNIGTRQKVLINYHKGPGKEAAAKATTREAPRSEEPAAVPRDVSTKVTVPLKRQKTLEELPVVEDVELTIKAGVTTEATEPEQEQQKPSVEPKEEETIEEVKTTEKKHKAGLKLNIKSDKVVKEKEDAKKKTSKVPTTPEKVTPSSPAAQPVTPTPKDEGTAAVVPLTPTTPVTTTSTTEAARVQETPKTPEVTFSPLPEIPASPLTAEIPTTPVEESKVAETPEVVQPSTPAVSQSLPQDTEEPEPETVAEDVAVQEEEAKKTSEEEPAEDKEASMVPLRRLVSAASYHEGDSCDPDEWEDNAATPEIDLEADSRPRVILSASDVPSVLKQQDEESEPTTPAINTEEPSSSAEETADTVIRAEADVPPAERLSVDKSEFSGSTNENAEAGSVVTGGDNAEETLSADGRPLSIDAESLIADDEQLLDEAIESTYGVHADEESVKVDEADDEVTPRYEESEKASRSLTVEEQSENE